MAMDAQSWAEGPAKLEAAPDRAAKTTNAEMIRRSQPSFIAVSTALIAWRGSARKKVMHPPFEPAPAQVIRGPDKSLYKMEAKQDARRSDAKISAVEPAAIGDERLSASSATFVRLLAS
ncbi:MAG: hypothetical protein CTY15_12410 [Methylocystis sp.]|nr:MAG: hypothetical protein CTY15_12410 [Methylocystis sp.]